MGRVTLMGGGGGGCTGCQGINGQYACGWGVVGRGGLLEGSRDTTTAGS